MNLTSLFNFNYLKENIKKSKAIILLCMLLLPILNGIILLMHGSTGDNFVASIYDVSGIILFGMYVIPLVLSITLFSFIYKKGAVDFTLSMPINKRQIFLTNTIGGMAIILIMQIINFIVIDSIDAFKKIEFEAWFKEVNDPEHAIWIGEGIANQFSIKLLKSSDRSLQTPIKNDFGYQVVSGRHALIKVLQFDSQELPEKSADIEEVI